MTDQAGLKKAIGTLDEIIVKNSSINTSLQRLATDGRA